MMKLFQGYQNRFVKCHFSYSDFHIYNADLTSDCDMKNVHPKQEAYAHTFSNWNLFLCFELC
ncbi:hypothetical protein Fmac_024463 [Flemingia macrophylla]|uniref:Uncharacterized protein n=1 Tax=Flemingia macrophylla TaxID=520843 RepID=A0ABD1LPG7_9FABA